MEMNFGETVGMIQTSQHQLVCQMCVRCACRTKVIIQCVYKKAVLA